MATDDRAREVLQAEMRAIERVEARFEDPTLAAAWEQAVERCLLCHGRVIVSGMGKTGLIGQKISATLASTGTPSSFLHPAEALHGDLGRVVADDVAILLSNSGSTEEIVRLLGPLKEIGATIIAITGNRDSPLAHHADILLDTGPIDEACPLGLAPTASTTAQLALGDALALCIQKRRGFSPEQYAFYHPAGALGRRLLKVEEIMRTGPRNPVIGHDRTVREALFAITEARAGAVSVVDASGALVGIFTDGDLRRSVAREPNVERMRIERFMTPHPITIGPDRLATEALRVLRERKIDELPVVDPAGKPVGMIDVQDLLAMGVV